jgi:hypothetical protein
MQRAASVARRSIHPLSLRAHPFRVEIREHIQLRIQPLNLPDMRLGQLNHRDLAAS